MFLQGVAVTVKGNPGGSTILQTGGDAKPKHLVNFSALPPLNPPLGNFIIYIEKVTRD